MMMMMMLMMTEGAAVPKAGGHSKHPSKTHKKLLETVPLQLDPNALVLSGAVRSLENASISPWAYKYGNARAAARQLAGKQWNAPLQTEFKVIFSLSLFSLHTQHFQRRVSVPAAVGGPLFAPGLSELGGTGGPEPGVQTHHAPDAAAAPGQVRRGGVRGGA